MFSETPAADSADSYAPVSTKPAPIRTGHESQSNPVSPQSNEAVDHAQTEMLEDELQRMAHALSVKFEELSLLHQLSERLKLDEESDEVCQCLLEELKPCIDSLWIAIDLYADEESHQPPRFYQCGEDCDAEWMRALADHTTERSIVASREPERFGVSVAIVNSPSATAPANVRTVVVPIQRQDQNLGRMIAVRTLDQEEFGTVEADLMKSTSMMLGVHLINQRQYLEMQQMFEGTIQSLVSALDAKDAYTSGHSSRVADLAVELATRLNFDEEGIARIRMAGILHDIGKIGVEDSVLRKPGRLTAEEFEKIKAHPVLGFDILQGIRQFNHILPAVRHHHESWDGSGYPDGLSGVDIPRDAQVLAVADAFDAMTSDRPYRSGMPLEKVIRIFEEGRGSQWASDVVDVLLSCPDVMSQYASRESE
ncbi:MAG: HD-GYP domain-containing protein [Planctomycetota bacterium]